MTHTGRSLVGIIRAAFLLITVFALGCYGTLDMEEEPFPSGEVDGREAEEKLDEPGSVAASGSPASTSGDDAITAQDMGIKEVDAGVAESSESDVEYAESADMGLEEADVRPAPGSVVEFQIVEGTGSGPWNSRDDAVVVYVGQILRITNLDSRDHQLHAGDDAAVDHGSRMVPGQSLDFDVERAMSLGDNPRLYDHGDGRSAAFWLESIE